MSSILTSLHEILKILILLILITREGRYLDFIKIDFIYVYIFHSKSTGILVLACFHKSGQTINRKRRCMNITKLTGRLSDTYDTKSTGSLKILILGIL